MSYQPESPRTPVLLRRLARGALLLLFIGVVVAIWGVAIRVRSLERLRADAEAEAIPYVAVVHPRPGVATDSVTLPANIQAFTETAIYARTSGYLKRWYVDIGAHVKAGALLAELDTPEVDAQLRQARADLATATANSTLADRTAERWRQLLVTGTVARQDVDEKVGDAEAKRTLVESASASVRRLEDLEGFKRVLAPFDGVITARRIDNGALVTSGSGTGTGQELFHLSGVGKVRVYVQVPQTYADRVRVGAPAQLRLSDRPTQYRAIIVSTARDIDSRTRTLLVEVAVADSQGLVPGSYGEATLQWQGTAGLPRIPANTLMFRDEGPAIAVVDSQSNVQIKAIRLGRDLGTEVEVVDGAALTDQVIVNPGDSIAAGQRVRITTDRN